MRFKFTLKTLLFGVGHMQRRLAGDAADVQTNATELGVALHQNHFETQISRAESRRITARTRAEHQQVARQVDAAVVAGGRRRVHRWRRDCYNLCSYLCRCDEGYSLIWLKVWRIGKVCWGFPSRLCQTRR